MPTMATMRELVRRSRWWLFGVGVVLLAVVGYAFLRPADAGADSWLTSTVDRATIRTSIAATGTLQAVVTVQVGSQVTGRVQSLHADFNSIVRKGQVIARIDPATFDAALVRARADLDDARAGLATARAALTNQKANLEAARATLLDAERVYKRTQELAKQEIASERDLEASEAADHEAAARVKQAEAQVDSADAAIEQAAARVKQAAAAVKLAEVSLDYTVITSPVDGVVVSRSVDVGQTVAASLQAPTLFIIANDLTRMQVMANVDEADIGHIGADAKVAFTVDSFPGEFFQGSIDQIRLNPVVTQNVVTYSVIVNVPNPELKLRPGMTANTTFTVAESDKALRLPNAALRFWPATVPRDREREMIAAAHLDAERPDPTAADPPAPAPSRHMTHEAHEAHEARPSTASDGETSPIASEAGVLRFPQVRKVRWRPRVIWLRGDGGKPEPRVVRVGITDGSYTELNDADLKEGDTVITGSNATADAQARPNNPFGGPFGARPTTKGGGGPGARRQ